MKKSGFTLVELMIVIAITGILAAAFFPSITGYQDRAIFAGQMESMRQMKQAIEIYYQDKGRYPITLGHWANPYGCYGVPIGTYTTDNWIPGIVHDGYMSRLPDSGILDKNCISQQGNFFIYSGSSSAYKLLSHGKKMAKYAAIKHSNLLDPARDGGIDPHIIETGSIIPWAWGYGSDMNAGY